MSFDQKLFNHRNVFKENIRGMGLASALGITGEQVIDYYGVPALFDIVKKIDNQTEFVTLLFLDALMNSCAHANHKSFIKEANRDVLVLNSYIYHEPVGNITHRYPQIILGLKKKWIKEDVEEFRELFKEYIIFYFNVLPPEIFMTVKEDSDLSNMETEYPSLGIKLSKNVLEEFQKLRAEI